MENEELYPDYSPQGLGWDLSCPAWHGGNGFRCPAEEEREERLITTWEALHGYGGGPFLDPPRRRSIDPPGENA